MYVHYTGSLRYDGMAVANVIGGVRPAMWVNKNVVEVVPESNREITEDPIEFRADHPFVAVIANESTGTVCFAAVIANPSEN